MQGRRKKLLFVMNTMGRGGAEISLLELLRRIDPARYEVSLFVLLSQGELIGRLPEHVRLLGRCDPSDVLSAAGKRTMYRRVLALLLSGGAAVRDLPYMLRNLRAMRRAGRVQPDKLLWRAVADGAPALRESFDLAVAYLEGASTYYVSRRVRAAKKAAFLHVDYGRAGYTRELDLDTRAAFDKIFCVSSAVRSSFLKVWPEYERKTEVFRNLHDRGEILRRADMPGGFTDGPQPLRIVTLGRLVPQKALEVSVEAMSLLCRQGVEARWYVFGEGEERPALEKKIAELGLRDRFLLPGTVDDPYPYLKQADLYVHCSRYEGLPVAVQEALILGKPVVCTDNEVMREVVTDGENGLLTPLEPRAVADTILRLIESPALRQRLEANAARSVSDREDTDKLLSLADG